MKDVPYGRWRDYDPERAVRFYALRLHEVGMIKSTPSEAHRSGDRLALPHGAEERAEGLMGHAPTRSASVRTGVKDVLARFARSP